MDSNQKRAASTASSEPPQKAARPSSPADESSWCMQCWKHPDDKCPGDGHRLLPLEDAKLEARKALDVVHRAWGRQQQKRLAAAEEAGEPAVLKITVPSEEGEDGLYVSGGSIEIKMAVTGALTEEEKKNVIEAMADRSIVFEFESSDEEVAASGSLDESCMASVIQKLPFCVNGQQLPSGTVLYFPDEQTLDMYDNPCQIDREKVHRRGRVFGRVTNGFCLRTERDEGYEYNPKYETPAEDAMEIEIEDVQFID